MSQPQGRCLGRISQLFVIGVFVGFALGTRVTAETWNYLDTNPVVVTGTALDLSAMNDGPAGKYGNVIVDADGDLQFAKRPGVKVRFYGANIPTFLTHAQTDAMVNKLSSMGYNVARVMGHDIMESWQQGIFNTPTSSNSALLSFKASSLDQLDYLFSRLKAKGIYVQMDVFTNFNFSSIPELATYQTTSGYLLPLTPIAYSFWERSVQMYLSHVNPYTGMALKDDPMVIGICPWNESLLVNLGNPNATLSALLLTQYNAFLATKGIAPATSYPITSTDTNPATNSFWKAIASPTDHYLTEFYTQKTLAAYGTMRTYLRNTLGVKCLINGINHINSPMVNYWRHQADTFDTHYYYQWDPEIVVPGSGYYVFNPTLYRMLSDVFTVNDGKPIGAYPFISINQEYQKPVFLTEFHDVFPNPGRDQAAIFASTIGAFQGWDEMSRFSFDRADNGNTDHLVGMFHEFNMPADPIALMSEYQGVLAFRMGYLHQAAPRFVIVRDKTYCQTKGSARWEADGVKNLAYLSYLYNTQTVYADVPSTPVAIYKIPAGMSQADIANAAFTPSNLVPITTTMSYLQVAQACINSLSNSDPAELAIKTLQQSYLSQNKLISETGEIVFDLTNRVYTVNTPYLIAAAGTLNNVTLNFDQANASMSSTATKGTLFVASLDRQRLDQSTRILIMNTTEAKATGAIIQPIADGSGNYSYTIPNSNATPTVTNCNLVRLESGVMTLTTSLNPLSYTAYKVGMNGARLGTLPVTANGNQITLNFATSSSFTFELISNPVVSTNTASAVTIILDDSNSNNVGAGVVTLTGSWTTSVFQPNYYGSDYHYRVRTGTGTNKVRWTPTISVAGDYQVYYRLPDGNSSRCSNANFTVAYSGGTQVHSVNEQPIGGDWVLLGTYHFVPGTAGYVELNDAGAADGSYLIADAVAFVLPNSFVIDNDDANNNAVYGTATPTGTWTKSSTQTSYYGTNYSYCLNSGNGTNKFRWTPKIATEGDYTVYYRLPNGDASRSYYVNFTVNHSSGAQTTFVNEQLTQGGVWRPLGTYHFASGTTGYVELSDSGATGGSIVVVDAIAFVQTNPLLVSTAPETVEMLALNPGTLSGQIALNWSPSQRASGYRIERSTSPDSGYALIAETAATDYTDSNLSVGLNYYYRVKAVNAEVPSASYSIVVNSIPFLANGIKGWRYTYFGTELDMNAAANMASPARDNVPNIIKYALGLNPLLPVSTGLYSTQSRQIGGVDYLTCIFTRDTFASDIECMVEATSDLAEAWQAIDPQVAANQVNVVQDTPRAGVQTLVIKDTQPMAMSRSRFMRLRVTLP